MLNSVSGVNFKGNPILEREGKFTQTQQPQAVAPEMPADKFEKPEKKRTGLKAVLWTVGVLAAAAIGLGVAAKKGKLPEIVEAPKGFVEHTKNFISKIGKGVADAYDNVADWCMSKINRLRGKDDGIDIDIDDIADEIKNS